MRITEEQYLIALEVIKNYKAQIEIETDFVNKQSVFTSNKTLNDIKMSKKLKNSLMDYFNFSWKEEELFYSINAERLKDVNLVRFKRVRWVGKITVQELTNIISEL